LIEQGYGAVGEVAAVADLPVVVDLDQHRSGEAEQGGWIGKDSDDVGAAFDLPVGTFQWVGRPDLLPMSDWESANAVTLAAAARSICSTFGS
jgi:hypothetical protein